MISVRRSASFFKVKFHRGIDLRAALDQFFNIAADLSGDLGVGFGHLVGEFRCTLLEHRRCGGHQFRQVLTDLRFALIDGVGHTVPCRW